MTRFYIGNNECLGIIPINLWNMSNEVGKLSQVAINLSEWFMFEYNKEHTNNKTFKHALETIHNISLFQENNLNPAVRKRTEADYTQKNVVINNFLVDKIEVFFNFNVCY